MLPSLQGYRRPDGSMGIRNHVVALACMDNAHPTVRRIASLVKGVVPLCPGFGRGQMGEDAIQHERVLVNTASHPNVYAAIVVSLEEESAKRVSAQIARTGRPVFTLSIEEMGGTLEVSLLGARRAMDFLRQASLLKPEPMAWSDFVLGVECGGSDGSSGIAANPLIGLLADKVIDAGGTVIMSETMELLGGEDLMAQRAVSSEVAKKIVEIVDQTVAYAREHNIDLLGVNPVPDNIAGGLSTIEEKALGSIKKGGTKPLQEVLKLGQRPAQKGFVFMDAPAPGVENLTSIVAGGCQAVVFSTGRGNCSGHPVAPVIKISGNPSTVEALSDNIDVDVSGVISGTVSMGDALKALITCLHNVASGMPTAADMLGEHEMAVSRIMKSL